MVSSSLSQQLRGSVQRTTAAPSSRHCSYASATSVSSRSTARSNPAQLTSCQAVHHLARRAVVSFSTSATTASAPAAAMQGSASKPSVALLGVGLMGGKMAQRLSGPAGFPEVIVWNRDSSKAQALAQDGKIKAVSSASEAAAQGQVLLLMLADAAAIQSVVLDDAVVKAQLPGKTVLMMSTIGPAESKRLAAAITDAGAVYIECPVLGSLPEVEKGTLQVLVGSDAPLDESQPGLLVLGGLTAKPKLIGGYGSASAMKLALNQLIVAETLAFSASLGLVRKNGGDEATESFMEILRASALYAPQFDKKLDKMMSREFGQANFPTKHLLKDVRLFSSEAEAAGMDSRMQRAAEQVVETACGMPGLITADYSAVYEAVVHPPEGAAGH